MRVNVANIETFSATGPFHMVRTFFTARNRDEEKNFGSLHSRGSGVTLPSLHAILLILFRRLLISSAPLHQGRVTRSTRARIHVRVLRIRDTKDRIVIIMGLEQKIRDFFSEIKDSLITIRGDQKKNYSARFYIRYVGVLGGWAARR